MKKFRALYQAIEHKKKQENFKLKVGITWEQVEKAKEEGTFIFKNYFIKMEESKNENKNIRKM